MQLEKYGQKVETQTLEEVVVVGEYFSEFLAHYLYKLILVLKGGFWNLVLMNQNQQDLLALLAISAVSQIITVQNLVVTFVRFLPYIANYSDCNPAANCSGHGKCNSTTGLCDCDDLWIGSTCESCKLVLRVLLLVRFLPYELQQSWRMRRLKQV